MQRKIYHNFILLTILSCSSVSGRSDNPTFACESYNRKNRTQNRCEGIDNIIVEQRVQASTHKKLWCIVLDNDNDVYSEQNLIINFTARGFGVASIIAERAVMNPSSVVFKLNSGINTIALYGLNKKSPFPRIKSLKLGNAELCSNDGRGRALTEDIPDQLALDTELYPIQDGYRFVNHCRDKSDTISSTTWCPGVDIPSTMFIVEKFKLHDENYWCLNFEPQSNDAGRKVLDVKLSDGNKELALNPPDAYISCVGPQGKFNIGEKPTTVVFGPSKSTNTLPDINSIMVDGKNICDHYKKMIDNNVITPYNPPIQKITTKTPATFRSQTTLPPNRFQPIVPVPQSPNRYQPGPAVPTSNRYQPGSNAPEPVTPNRYQPRPVLPVSPPSNRFQPGPDIPTRTTPNRYQPGPLLASPTPNLFRPESVVPASPTPNRYQPHSIIPVQVPSRPNDELQPPVPNPPNQNLLPPDSYQPSQALVPPPPPSSSQSNKPAPPGSYPSHTPDSYQPRPPNQPFIPFEPGKNTQAPPSTPFSNQSNEPPLPKKCKPSQIPTKANPCELPFQTPLQSIQTTIPPTSYTPVQNSPYSPITFKSNLSPSNPVKCNPSQPQSSSDNQCQTLSPPPSLQTPYSSNPIKQSSQIPDQSHPSSSINIPKKPIFYETPGHADPSPQVLSTDPSYKYLDDCMKKRTSVPYTSWCKNRAIPSNVFIAEQFQLNGVNYWCFNFEPDLTRKGPEVLTIKSKDQYKLFSWIPGEAVRVNDKSTDAKKNTFYLGEKRTTIEFSPFDQENPVPEIESIEINGLDVCDHFKHQSDNNIPEISKTYVPSIENNFAEETRPRRDESRPSQMLEKRASILSTDPGYKYLNDCLDKRASKSHTTYCKDYKIPSSAFLIEKFNVGDEDYWCFNFPPLENHNQKRRHALTMSFNGSSICPISWLPADASSSDDPQNSASTSIFYIGQKETTVAVGPEEHKTGIPDISSIKVDGKDICDYYKSYAHARY